MNLAASSGEDADDYSSVEETTDYPPHDTQPHSYVMGDAGVDAQALADALRTTLRGEVRFDDGSRALYATDGSNYRQVPIGVVIPRDNDDAVGRDGVLPAVLVLRFSAAAAARAWPANAAMWRSSSISRNT